MNAEQMDLFRGGLKAFGEATLAPDSVIRKIISAYTPGNNCSAIDPTWDEAGERARCDATLELFLDTFDQAMQP